MISFYKRIVFLMKKKIKLRVKLNVCKSEFNYSVEGTAQQVAMKPYANDVHACKCTTFLT